MTRLRRFVLICSLMALPAMAIWTPVGQPAPVDRVLANLQAQIKEHPEDASAWLALARVHSYAFFIGGQQVPMRGGSPYFSNLPQGAQPPQPSPENLAHLKESIVAFRKSIALKDTLPVPYLGLAWDLEQGAAYADRIGPPPGEEGSQSSASHWIDRALAGYRQAYERASKGEMAIQFGEPISQEAAARIIAIDQQRLKVSKQDLPDVRAEITRMEEAITKLRKAPRAITPVIFSFREGTALRDLLAPDVHVAFDLDGFGGARWSWLKPSTGILVWDPEHRGSIQSGLQLFGNVTWWMFWRDGFQALSALDDNRDGWLSGAELTGLAVWIDRNQNGRSDPGEVISLAEAGIVRISVAAAVDGGGALGNARGIEFSDGRRTPAYDWIADGERARESQNRTD